MKLATIWISLIILATECFCIPLMPSSNFVYMGMKCNETYLGIQQINCVDLETNIINTWKRTDFISKFGTPFQFNSSLEREIWVENVRWIQRGFYWRLYMHGGNSTTISDTQFHGLYSNNLHFKDLGVIGRLSLCHTRGNSQGYKCKFPWGEERDISRDLFISLFSKSDNPNKGMDKKELCEGFSSIVFWDYSQTKWRCWNSYLWRENNSSYVGSYTIPEFESHLGQLDQILNNQPDKQVNNCTPLFNISQTIQIHVWNCTVSQFNNPNFDFRPTYLPEEEIGAHSPIVFRMGLNLKRKFARLDQTYFYAIHSDNNITSYMSEPQFKYVFFENKDIVSVDKPTNESSTPNRAMAKNLALIYYSDNPQWVRNRMDDYNAQRGKKVNPGVSVLQNPQIRRYPIPAPHGHIESSTPAPALGGGGSYGEKEKPTPKPSTSIKQPEEPSSPRPTIPIIVPPPKQEKHDAFNFRGVDILNLGNLIEVQSGTRKGERLSPLVFCREFAADSPSLIDSNLTNKNI